MTEPAADLIATTEAMLRKRFAGETTGHDWPHTDRVRRLALRIAEEETAAGSDLDRGVIELAALLHDVRDWKFAGGDDSAGVRIAETWLQEHAVPTPTIAHVAGIIAAMSFKGAGVPTPMPTTEGAIVQDADRLDALGAVGIARAFAYGGHTGAVFHDPAIPPRLHDSFDAYKRGGGTTINHFAEKLLLLRDRMNTAAGRRLAVDRHAYMETFLARFHAEWEGTA